MCGMNWSRLQRSVEGWHSWVKDIEKSHERKLLAIDLEVRKGVRSIFQRGEERKDG